MGARRGARYGRRVVAAVLGLAVAAGCGGGVPRRALPSPSGAWPSSTATPTPSGTPSAPPLPPAPETTPGPSLEPAPPRPTALPRVPVASAGPPLLVDPAHPRVLYRVPTTRPVVFLTIDDGWTRDPGLPSLLGQARVPTTAFLVGQALGEAPDYWRSLTRLGALVEDHTLTHARLTSLTEAQQQAEICGDADLVTRTLGRRPTLLRPPYGSWDASTVVAAGRCGLGAVVLWDVSVVHGVLHFAEGSRLRPGDVLLLHFTPWIGADLDAALTAVQRAGFSVARLEDAVRPLVPTPSPTPSRTRSPTKSPAPSAAPSPTPTRTPTPSPTPTPTPSPTPTRTETPLPSPT